MRLLLSHRRRLAVLGGVAVFGGLAALGLSLLPGVAAIAAQGQPLRLVQTIPLDGVEGRLDHMAIDLERHRLFVAAFGHGTVEVVDLRSAKRVQSLGPFHEAQGVAFVGSPPRLFVSSGDGTCEMLDGATYARLRTIRLSSDADNIRYDAGDRRVYVGHGSGALATLDSVTGDSLDSIPLSGHPEAFEIEPGGSRIFVNIADAGEVAIIDRAKGCVIASWKPEGLAGNFPMVHDGPSHRLFVGCRQPAAVLIFDDESGKKVASVPIDKDADDLYYDSASRQVLVSCGAGFINALRTSGTDHWAVSARIATRSGARTSLYLPALQEFFLAVPRRGSQRAEIRVYQTTL